MYKEYINNFEGLHPLNWIKRLKKSIL